MKRSVVLGILTTITLVFVLSLLIKSEQEMPFGGKKDVEFANMLWKAMDGYEKWPMKSEVYPGQSPHGKFLRLYYNIVVVDGKPYHVVIKDNFGGKDATLDKVSESPGKYLAAVTVMVQRELGYDPDNKDWFWVKYKADGTIDKNANGMSLAGRVAKGADKGCIGCHSNAKDSDYFFTNDTDMKMSMAGKELLEERCNVCHNLNRIYRHKKVDKELWTKTVDRMIRLGAKLNEDEREAVIEYLVSL